MNRILLGAAALAALVSAAHVPGAHAGEVADREGNQQRRIGQGVRSGQLTGRETASIERREGNIDASRRADLRAHGGHLTPAEYRNLNARQNSVSHQIYDDKHNLATQPGVPPQ